MVSPSEATITLGSQEKDDSDEHPKRQRVAAARILLTTNKIREKKPKVNG